MKCIRCNRKLGPKNTTGIGPVCAKKAAAANANAGNGLLLAPLNAARFFCPNGICDANDCRCPQAASESPSFRDWWADGEHRRRTIFLAATFAAVVMVIALVQIWGYR